MTILDDIGSGEGPAIGALDALLDHTLTDPCFAVRAACKIGITRDRFSGAPVHTACLPAHDD